MARGRIPKISYVDQWNLFRLNAEKLQDPNIKCNDPIFSILSEELEYRMTPLALYLALKRNRNTIFGINIRSSDEPTSLSDEMNCSASSSPSSLISASKSNNFSSAVGKSKSFSFNLDTYEWRKIKPLSGYKKRSGTSTYRHYKTLPKYKWSNMLKEKIWTHSRLPCTWNFKKNKIEDDKINLHGKCTQCCAEINLSNQNMTDKIVKFLCNVRHFDVKFKHNPNTKSKLTSYRRQQLAKNLRYKPAIMVHNELASKLIDSEDYKSSPILPSISALRKIKSDARLEHLPHNNPIISLLMLAQGVDHDNKNIIREICMFPDFRLLFWSDCQIKYYNEYHAKFHRITITIDATGSFFEKVCLPDGTTVTKRLFLYVGLITGNAKLKSVPIFQMVTDSHSDETILIWLKKWLTFINNPPHEIITDDSSALVSACVKAFALFDSTKTYITQLFSTFEGTNSKRPKAFIRLDTSHFIKSLHNLECFKSNIDVRIKYFYIRCLVFLKHCENYITVKATIHDILNVCLGQYTNDMDNDCKEAKLRLDKLLNGVGVDHLDLESKSTDKTYKFDDNTEDFSFSLWFDDILKTVKRKNQDNMILKYNENVYYFPPFIPTLRRIILRLPLWSNLSCSYFDSENKAPSSSGIESYFKTLKHLVFKTKVQKYRIDEFIKKYSIFLDGIIKTALADVGENVVNKTIPRKKHSKKRKFINLIQNKKNAKKVKSKISTGYFNADSIFSDQPSFIENWRGEAEMDKAKTKHNVKLLKNGNLCRSVLLNDIYVTLKNTCGFDSVMYFLSAGFNENENIREFMATFNKDLIPQYIKNLCDIESTDDDIYLMRAKIASQYFSPLNEKGNHISYDCQCNITYIFEHILLRYFFSATFTKKCLNTSCQSNKIKRDIAFLPLNINFIDIFGIGILEEAINIDEGNRNCPSCDGQLIYNYEISKIISFDLNGTENLYLTNVPVTITVKNKTYKIMGASEFIPSLIPGGLGHYRCHCFINERFFCYDDQHLKIIESPVQKIFIHSLSYIQIYN